MNIALDEFSLPLDPPLTTATGELSRRDGIIVTVMADTPGFGEATPLAGWTESLAECRSALDTARDCLAEQGRQAALSALTDTPAARHGLSLSLLDHDARVAGKPVYRYLDLDEPAERLPVNATIDAGPIDETIAATRTALQAGFRTIKLKLGSRSLEDDLTRIDRVKALLPSDCDLRLDVNGAWSLQTAQRALFDLQALNLSYVEQPLPPDAPLSDYASFDDIPVDIAVDEALTIHPWPDLIDSPGIDVLILKPMVLGGIDRALEIAQAARASGVDTVVTTTIDGVIARTAAIHLAASLTPTHPSGLATADRLTTDLGPDPAPVTQGTIDVPDSDGLGVTPRTHP